MFFPPSILRVRITADGQRKRNTFVPLILLWPLVLLAAVLALPLVAILAIFRPRSAWSILKIARRFAVFCSDARGLHVEVRHSNEEILVYIK